MTRIIRDLTSSVCYVIINFNFSLCLSIFFLNKAISIFDFFHWCFVIASEFESRFFITLLYFFSKMFDYINVDPKFWNMTLFKKSLDCDNFIISFIKNCLSWEVQNRNLFGESMQKSSNHMRFDDSVSAVMACEDFKYVFSRKPKAWVIWAFTKLKKKFVDDKKRVIKSIDKDKIIDYMSHFPLKAE